MNKTIKLLHLSQIRDYYLKSMDELDGGPIHLEYKSRSSSYLMHGGTQKEINFYLAFGILEETPSSNKEETSIRFINRSTKPTETPTKSSPSIPVKYLIKGLW